MPASSRHCDRKCAPPPPLPWRRRAIGPTRCALPIRSTFGSKAKQFELQLAFNEKLTDSIEGGLGNLVDADLAREHARLQALQIKQQLGLQALSIANQAPQSILALFR